MTVVVALLKRGFSCVEKQRGLVGAAGAGAGAGGRPRVGVTPGHPVPPGTATHVVPLRLELLLLEALVLPEVTQVRQRFPDDQQEDPDQHDSRHGAPHNGSNVGALWTL